MPAAAVTPAPIAYIKVVAVKKLVVGYLAQAAWSAGLRKGVWCVLGVCLCHPSRYAARRIWIFYFEKIRVFKAGSML